MAEAIFRSQTASSPHISDIDSAGTSSYNNGSNPDPRTMAVLRDNNIKNYTHHARKVSLSDFKKFDYIVAMDDSNFEDLELLRERATRQGKGKAEELGKVVLFGDYGGRKGEVVVDPWYDDGRDGFEVAFKQMRRFSSGFLRDVIGLREGQAAEDGK